jgi:hypothetical protein
MPAWGWVAIIGAAVLAACFGWCLCVIAADADARAEAAERRERESRRRAVPHRWSGAA